jgi:hypothetical protein
MSTRAHVNVIILDPGGRAASKTLEREAVRALASSQQEVGRTEHFVVYSDGSSAGDGAARVVLARAEADYSAVRGWFGGLEVPAGAGSGDASQDRSGLPIQVFSDPQAGGAYHFGCAATDLYIQPDVTVATGLMVAELVEVFEAVQGRGWDCGHVNGEALSRVLASERTPALGSLQQQTGQGWWADGRGDYVTVNDADDQNPDANGCGPLFLLYLHSQLGFSWEQIVAAAGSSLGATYQTLTGQGASGGFQDFLSRLATRAVGEQLQLPASGNPFPIGATTAPPASTGPDGGSAGLGGSGGVGGLVTVGLVGLGLIAVVVVLLLATGVLHLG